MSLVYADEKILLNIPSLHIETLPYLVSSYFCWDDIYKLKEFVMEVDLMQVVANLGFPALVTMYLLVRIEGKLENLTFSINDLSTNIKKLHV